MVNGFVETLAMRSDVVRNVSCGRNALARVESSIASIILVQRIEFNTDFYSFINRPRSWHMACSTVTLCWTCVLEQPLMSQLSRDCRAAYRHGRRQSRLYVVHPQKSSLIVVYCEMEQDGGGWTVLQRNTVSQKTSWDHSWTAYKKGFGNLEGNHWLGNTFIYLLTRQNAFAVRSVIVNADGEKRYANYHSFALLDSEGNGYALRLGDYSGDAGDALTIIYESGIHDNMKFSTLDKDQDRRIPNNCALNYAGGWWYDSCHSALLNSDNGIYWKGLCTEYKPCESAYIMIRPNGKNCNRHIKF
ncbi:fibrinogen-like protein 1-like protein [Lepidochelys kempii]|uniref:fibrinogen-like protein 1-like protein n=1 Tax=Lepidochelys kempii TaxID=8472 RepID=UPI003C6F471A